MIESVTAWRGMKRVLLCAAPLLAGCSTLAPSPRLLVPYADYHQHLVSPEFAVVAKAPERDARALLAELDTAGIRKAIVLSVGYSFADERKQLSDPDGRTRAENDWTSAQVGLGNGRLIGFCSANPMRDAALAEVERCLGLPGMAGIKIHVGNGGLSFRNPDHVARLGSLFALAERRQVPVLVHMRPRGGSDYGAEDVPVFLDRIVARAPSVPVIVAHLGASSPGYVAQNDEVMAAFAAAARSPAMRNIFFDVSANIGDATTTAEAATVVQRMRQIGIDHFVYGSDLSPPGGTIASGWQQFRNKLPLTEAELRRIADRRLPFLR